MKTRLFALLLAALPSLSAPTLAAPAPYYLWMSKIDGSRVCSQTPMGPGWKIMGGPYADIRCRKPA